MHKNFGLLWPLLALLVLATGCGDRDFKEYVPNVVENIPDKVEKLKPKVVDQDGSGIIELDGETKFSSCFVSLINVPERGSVLKIQNQAGAGDKLPSFYVHAIVDATDLSQLVDESLQTKLFVQKSAESGIWSCNEQELARIEIGQKNDRYVVKIVEGYLENTLTQTRQPVTGTLECVAN